MDKFTIIRDTREQNPLSFRATEYCNGHIDQKIEHGDYSLVGLEDKIFVERKASASELARNITEARFDRLLENCANYPYKFIICEFSLQDVINFPYKNGLPKSVVQKIKIRGKFILSKLQNYQIHHGVQVVFCGSRIYAQKYILDLLKKIHNIEHNK